MKHLFLPLAGMMLLSLSACNDLEHKPNTPNTQQLKGNLPTCIVPEDENLPVTLTDSPTYSFTVDNISGVWKIGVDKIEVQGFENLSFTSPEIYGTSGYNTYLSYLNPFTTKDGTKIEGLEAVLARDYYYYTGDSSLALQPLGILSMAKFKVPGKYTVHAFPRNCYYGGQVESTYPGAGGTEQHYTSANTQFGVSVNIDSRTAEITIYNAKFAEPMPSMYRMVLSGLTLEGDHEYGYVIKGKNIIPVVGEGLNAVSYPDFVFNEIEFHPTNALITKGECEFTVAGRFHGEFTGNVLK